MSIIQNTEGKEPADFLAMTFISASNVFSNLSYHVNEVNSTFKKFKELIKHLHACHEHPCDHLYSGIEVTQKIISHGNSLFTNPSNVNRSNELLPHLISNVAVNSLAREYSHEIDCDNNGLIFGKDFLFSINDENVPKILFTLQRMKIYDISIKRMTWKDFLLTVPSNTFV